ncbi:MAG: metalloregulator ArsR/SmtB family transcription factor [Bauldia sp.]|nr:metalloregulator ArsR/SmtB family transcription factor [Bauldia sp.]
MSAVLERRPAFPVQPPDRGIDEEGLAALAKALAHPARVHIVRLLLEKQSCIGCDIVDEVGLAQSTVSEHLRILKAAGVVTGDIERPRVCYSLNPEAVAPLAGLLDTILDRGAAGTLGGSICCAPGADC